jgi:hypothetical protein
LKPEDAKSAHLGDDKVAVVDVGLDAGGDEPAAGAGQDVGFDHQLDEGPERGALDHLERTLLSTPSSKISSADAD